MQNKKNKSCDPALSFEECELAILRQAVDETEKLQQEKKIANSEEVQKMIAIVEKFIIDRRCIFWYASQNEGAVQRRDDGDDL
ncbi:MAG: hypothetical protein EBS96_14225 [Spartobacteria bacterium]|nr:hypothetical protein [Spartobacteria bacterium]